MVIFLPYFDYLYECFSSTSDDYSNLKTKKTFSLIVIMSGVIHTALKKKSIQVLSFPQK